MPHVNTTKILARAAQACRTRSPVERMADDLRELAFADQNADEAALVARGWSGATIKRLAPRATEIARRQSVRQVAR